MEAQQRGKVVTEHQAAQEAEATAGALDMLLVTDKKINLLGNDCPPPSGDILCSLCPSGSEQELKTRYGVVVTALEG